jgi:DNA end-binding protein Ku
VPDSRRSGKRRDRLGYEYEKGQYVIIDKQELARLRGERERTITIEAVVAPSSIDPLYFTDKSYYLFPDGKIGEKPFALLREALAEEEYEAVARGVLFGREELILIRPSDDVLAVTALKYAAEVAAPGDFGSVTEQRAKKEELALTKTLLKSFAANDFSLAAFADRYNEDLKELIHAKVEGKEIIVTAEKPERPPTINLMDALKRSLAGQDQPRRKRKAVAASRPRRKSG